MKMIFNFVSFLFQTSDLQKNLTFLEGSFANHKLNRSNDRETIKLLVSTTNRLKKAIDDVTEALSNTDLATYVLEKAWDQMKPKMDTLMVRRKVFYAVTFKSCFSLVKSSLFFSLRKLLFVS